MARVAINGLGRIGRATFKQIMDEPKLELVAVNDIIPADNLAYLLNYDSVYGPYRHRVESRSDTLLVADKEVRVLSVKNPAELPWGDMDVDVVFECTGLFTESADLKRHAQAGARRVILSAPTKSEELMTVVHGVNKPGKGQDQMISCASCTTNSITPVVEIFGRKIGIKKAMMTTVHAYTSTQALVDGPNKRFRRGRAAAANLVPASTGAAVATTKALPQYKGLFDGVAVRTPVPVGSVSDITFLAERSTTVEEVNQAFKDEAMQEQYREVIRVVEEPIVSSDIVGDTHASVVDLSMTRVVDGDLVKVMAWYDNEWGYTAQMIREALRMVAS